jgi:hypothetical protein
LFQMKWWKGFSHSLTNCQEWGSMGNHDHYISYHQHSIILMVNTKN